MSATPRRLLVLAVSTLVSLALVEGLHRGWLAGRGRPYSSEATATELARLVDPAGAFVPRGAEERNTGTNEQRGRPILHPYYGSEKSHDTGGVLAAFRNGFAPDEHVIVLVGGSVAASWASNAEPGMHARLAQDPRFAGRRIRLLNYAHSSYKQPQQVMRVAYLFSLGYRPDAVINLDGFNEVALSLQNLRSLTHPVYPPSPVWGAIVTRPRGMDDESLVNAGRLWLLREEAQQTASFGLSLGLHRSSVLGGLVLRRMRRINRERFEVNQALQSPASERGKRPRSLKFASPAMQREVRGPDFDPDPAQVLEAGAQNWLESSISLHSLCAARDVFYLHVLQPTLHDTGAKPLSSEEREMGPAPHGWKEGARDGYPLLRALIPELEARGVRFVDASRAFADVRETLYYDHCHFVRKGNSILDDVIAQGFLDHLPD